MIQTLTATEAPMVANAGSMGKAKFNIPSTISRAINWPRIAIHLINSSVRTRTRPKAGYAGPAGVIRLIIVMAPHHKANSCRQSNFQSIGMAF
jgi:hypothetical protein